MNPKYNVGDKFINLVENESRQLKIGDVITMELIEPFDKIIADKTLNYRLNKEGNLTQGWWYTDASLAEFTIPFTELSEKEQFVYLLAGAYPIHLLTKLYPHKNTYVFDKDTFGHYAWGIRYKTGRGYLS